MENDVECEVLADGDKFETELSIEEPALASTVLHDVALVYLTKAHGYVAVVVSGELVVVFAADAAAAESVTAVVAVVTLL